MFGSLRVALVLFLAISTAQIRASVLQHFSDDEIVDFKRLFYAKSVDEPPKVNLRENDESSGFNIHRNNPPKVNIRESDKTPNDKANWMIESVKNQESESRFLRQVNNSDADTCRRQTWEIGLLTKALDQRDKSFVNMLDRLKETSHDLHNAREELKVVKQEADEKVETCQAGNVPEDTEEDPCYEQKEEIDKLYRWLKSLGGRAEGILNIEAVLEQDMQDVMVLIKEEEQRIHEALKSCQV